jgi:hypothetical protein
MPMRDVDDRQMISFPMKLGSDHATVRLAGGKAAKAGLVTLRGPQGSFDVSAALLARAASAGLVRRNALQIVPTAQANAYLRRHRADEANAFSAQHRDLEFSRRQVEGAEQTVCINRLESPLAAMERLKGRNGEAFFPREAIAAGERLFADFTRAQLQPRITMSFEPRLSAATKGSRGANAELSDTALAARLNVARAIEAMGPELSGAALDACCFMKGLELIERERQWPARSAKLMLKTALLALHRHYVPAARQKTRHWGAEGYRPELGV